MARGYQEGHKKKTKKLDDGAVAPASATQPSRKHAHTHKKSKKDKTTNVTNEMPNVAAVAPSEVSSTTVETDQSSKHSLFDASLDNVFGSLVTPQAPLLDSQPDDHKRTTRTGETKSNGTTDGPNKENQD